MRLPLRGMAVAAALAIGACDGGKVERARLDALAGQIERLEERLAAVEKHAEPVEGLRNDVASLDRRLTAIESGLRDLASRSTAPPAAAPTPAPAPTTGPGTSTAPPAGARRSMPSGPSVWGRTTREERSARRDALRSLSEEFRARLARLRVERAENPTATAEQQQKIQDVLQWYRDQRRAIIRGDKGTDQEG